MSLRTTVARGVARGTSGAAILVAAFGFVLAMPAPACAQAQPEVMFPPPRGRPGPRVVQKTREFVLRDEKQAIAGDGGRIQVYRVERVDGARLWLKPEGKAGGPGGWAAADRVIPLDKAVAFFTDRIRMNPEDGFSCLMRAAIKTGAIERSGDPFDRPLFKRDPFVDLDAPVRPGPPQAAIDPDLVDTWPRLMDGDKNLADFISAVFLDPKDASAYYGLGMVRARKGEYDTAIADFTRAIGLEPGNAHAYFSRACAWGNKGEYDKALADYTEVIRLNRGPDHVYAYRNRGRAWYDKGEYDKALADFDEAIRLDAREPYAHYNRGVILCATRRGGAADEAKAALNIQGWRDDLSMYAALLGHFDARRAGQKDQARSLLDEAAVKCDPSEWPYPVIKHLRGELDEGRLLAAAVDDIERAEAHCYLGLEALEDGRNDAAIAHFRRVKERGIRRFPQYVLSVAELDRLLARGAEGDGP